MVLRRQPLKTIKRASGDARFNHLLMASSKFLGELAVISVTLATDMFFSCVTHLRAIIVGLIQTSGRRNVRADAGDSTFRIVR
jgi:hypothetical protein